MAKSIRLGGKAVVAAIGITALVSACGGGATGSISPRPSASLPTSEPSLSASPSPSAAPAVAFPLKMTDAIGKAHTFEKPLTQIGCAWVGCEEILADLGIVPWVDTTFGEGSPVLDKPFWYPNGKPPHTVLDILNTELWAATDSEIIIVRGPVIPEMAAFDGVVDLVFLNHPSADEGGTAVTGTDAYRTNLRWMGQMTDREAEAEAAIARYDRVLAKIKAAAPAGAADNVVANIEFREDGTFFLLSDPENPFCTELKANGLGSCIATDVPWQTEINAEEFLALDPDWIAYSGYSEEQTWKTRNDPVWNQLSAVKSGQVYDTGSRTFCCSLRGLEHALQDYAFNVFGPSSGVPDPGWFQDFDPAKSPLAAES